MDAPHRFDQSLRIESLAANVWQSKGSALYWNVIGPYGGWIAAMLLHAVQSEPDARGDPLALQAQFIGPLAQAPFTVHTHCLRQNRSMAFWRSEIRQAREPGGEQKVCAQATVTLGTWRDTFTLADAVMPRVARPEDTALAATRPGRQPAFLAHYEMRPLSGAMFAGADTMDSLIWIRDAQPRPLDARALVALCDAPYPSLWIRLTEPVLMTTVVFNVFFRATPARMAAAGGAHLLADSSSAIGQAGYFDQSANLWSEDGALLAQTQQLAWFDEKPLRAPPA